MAACGGLPGSDFLDRVDPCPGNYSISPTPYGIMIDRLSFEKPWGQSSLHVLLCHMMTDEAENLPLFQLVGTKKHSYHNAYTRRLISLWNQYHLETAIMDCRLDTAAARSTLKSICRRVSQELDTAARSVGSLITTVQPQSDRKPRLALCRLFHSRVIRILSLATYCCIRFTRKPRCRGRELR